MNIKTKKYLFDIQTSIESILNFLGDNPTFSNFYSDDKTKRAVEREIEIIGAALKRINQIDSSIEISWTRDIIALRNRVSHEYDRIDYMILWSIIMDDLPLLKSEVEVLLEE